jgi:hypothetical protein
MGLSQAIRATQAVMANAGSGDRPAASDEVRTYMTMMMIAAPILIDSKTPRVFVETSPITGRYAGAAPAPGRADQRQTGSL